MPNVNESGKRRAPKPRLTNRKAGLVTKVGKPKNGMAPPALPSTVVCDTTGEHYRLDDIRCEKVEVVDITTLANDPMNARLHPDENVDEIKASLRKFGQAKPIVVCGKTLTIAAGNGTYLAAKALGWRKIAVVHREFLTQEEFHSYALADNRTAESSQWDFKVVHAIEALLRETSNPMIGWTDDELEVIRSSYGEEPWQPPTLDEDAESEVDLPFKIVFSTKKHKAILKEAIELEKKFFPEDADKTDDEIITEICRLWIEEHFSEEANAAGT